MILSNTPPCFVALANNKLARAAASRSAMPFQVQTISLCPQQRLCHTCSSSRARPCCARPGCSQLERSLVIRGHCSNASRIAHRQPLHNPAAHSSCGLQAQRKQPNPAPAYRPHPLPPRNPNLVHAHAPAPQCRQNTKLSTLQLHLCCHPCAHRRSGQDLSLNSAVAQQNCDDRRISF